MAGGQLNEIAHLQLPGAANTRLHVAQGSILLGLDNGQLVLVRSGTR